MTYPLITDSVNMTKGMGDLLCYVNADVTGFLFVNLLLVSIFLIIALGGYFAQKRSTGQGDFPQWMALGGFVTTIFAFIMRLVTDVNGNSCLVNIGTLAVCIAVTIAGIMWLFFSDD
jgi:hypothetical protein